MLQDTFDYMKIYLDNSQSPGLKIFMYVMLLILVSINITGSIIKWTKVDKTYGLPEAYVEPLPLNEGGQKETQLTEALIEDKGN